MRLLVIEDNPHHGASARKFFAGKGFKVDFINDLKLFVKAMELYTYDGVLSDIFFPYDNLDYSGEVPAGVAVLFICKAKAVPCVLVTAGYHHGKKYQWIHTMLCELGFPLMIDVDGYGMKEVEAPEKNWAEAFEYLTSMINQK